MTNKKVLIIGNGAREDALAKKYLQDENLYILVVGDGASNRAKLEKLGYDLIELDAKGDVVEDMSVDTKK